MELDIKSMTLTMDGDAKKMLVILAKLSMNGLAHEIKMKTIYHEEPCSRYQKLDIKTVEDLYKFQRFCIFISEM